MTVRPKLKACRAAGVLVVGAIVAVTAALPAFADEEAGPEDRARITEALQAAGYESFEEVELDDGVWEVDDAVGSDGVQYDLKLNPDTLEIVEKEED
jgi:Peptidase propeptide and YPEB domain